MTAANQTAEPQPPSYYERLGSAPGIRQLVTDFYDAMECNDKFTELRRIHAPDLAPMRETLFEFLSGWLGGPRTYWERPDAKCMMSAHAGLPITLELADQWITCMQYAVNKIPAEQEDRDAVIDAFTRIGRAMIRQPAAQTVERADAHTA